MIAADFLTVFGGAFWTDVVLPAALLGLSLLGGLVTARGRRTKQASVQILGAFFGAAGLYLGEGQTALPLWAFGTALLCGLLARYERGAAPTPRRVKRHHA